MADRLPLECMYDIFSRLPPKSLARFCCVSKLWCDYINDSYFKTMHAKRSEVDHRNGHPMLIMFHDQNPRATVLNSPCTLTFLKYKEDEEGVEVEKERPAMKFTCKRWSHKYTFNMFVGFCNGLLYTFKQVVKGRNMLVVIHPLRKECYELPPIDISSIYGRYSWEWSSCDTDLEESYGLGFDDSTHTFKMVFVVLRGYESRYSNKVLHTMVHVLGTNSWRKIPQVPFYPITGEGVFANGCLHWLSSYEHVHCPLTNFGKVVITFDIVKEGFGFIHPPHRRRPSGEIMEKLVDLDGKVGYVYSILDSRVEVWLLKEKAWVMHCKFEQKPPLPEGFIKVLGFWNEKGDVLVASFWKRMFIYNLESGSFNEVSFANRNEELRKGGLEIRLYQASLFARRYSIKKINLI